MIVCCEDELATPLVVGLGKQRSSVPPDAKLNTSKEKARSRPWKIGKSSAGAFCDDSLLALLLLSVYPTPPVVSEKSKVEAGKFLYLIYTQRLKM